ncbi:MAG TPA: UPF0182 family protein [Acidimicrobiia bacterium]|jgi:hypothetical protein
MFMRAPAAAEGERRRGLLFGLLIVVGAFILLTWLSSIWTEYLWFDSVDFSQVWWIQRGWSLVLGVLGILIAGLVLWGNLSLTDQLSLRYAVYLGDDGEAVVNFREWLEPRFHALRRIGILAIAVLMGVTVASWRDDVLLFLNARSFGQGDPLFGNDIGFYVFRLPFISDLLTWSFNLVAITALAVGIAYLVSGSIRFNRGSFPVVAQGAKAHISVLLALLALIRAGMYRLDTYSLLYTSRSPQFYGAGYADVHAKLPALQLLLAIAVLAAVVFIVNIWRRDWTLAVVAVGAWLVVAIAAGSLYPALVQRFSVVPRQLARETPFIEHNIAYTRAAYGLGNVEVVDFAASPNLTAEDIEANRPTIDNLRLWHSSVLLRAYSPQEIRSWYALDHVDSDRYLLDDQLAQVLVAVRELDEGNPDLPTDWQNRRLTYTHGFGAVASPAAKIDPSGGPDYLLRDVPPEATDPDLELTQPRIYFGETYQPGLPVVVNTEANEIDFPEGTSGSAFNHYDGEAGVPLSSIWRRLAYGFRYRDLNLVISSLIRSDSRVLMERNVEQMVHMAAPFLALDSDPYPVMLDGSVIWVLDLYTSTDLYPYSTPADLNAFRRVSRQTGLSTGLAYVRNSVKATVDAYDGTITFYVVDSTDPIVLAWREVYPDLFTSADQIPAGLAAHFRYPQDLFKLQSEVYRSYHVTDPATFFNRTDAWSISRDPSTAARNELLFGDSRDLTDPSQVSFIEEMLPYYLLTRLPGEEQLSYLLMQPFNPQSKENMSAFLAADSSLGTYGRLIVFRMPAGETVFGTGQVNNQIEADDEIAEQFSLWRGKGSAVIRGDMLVVPVDDSILYVQPVYLEAEAGTNAIPQFQRVIVVFGERIEWGETLDEALALVFGTEPAGPEEPSNDQVETLLRLASARFDQAQQALAAGDLAGYQQAIEEARDLVEQALEQVTTPSARSARPIL